MDYTNLIANYRQQLIDTFLKMDTESINQLMNLLTDARDNDKQIFIMGNGGSGATASHFAGDFNKGLSLGKPLDKRYRVICLVDNSPTLLSLANDVSYDEIFVEQLKNFLRDGDVVIGISGSGNSENVLRAVKYAKDRGNKVVGLTGYNGGTLKNMSDVSVHVPIDNMQITEDLHMVLTHLMFWVFNQSEQ
ncbi:MAG: SIS domain-containing protein [Clostridia bacterium]|nr:SIS domain-containing protein [Clostridia bacterium]